jgi:DNA replication protein DnaC
MICRWLAQLVWQCAGSTGVGKSWLASALGHKACRDNRSVLYQRVPRLFEAPALGRGDGRHPRLLRNLGRADLLILDLCAARSDVELRTDSGTNVMFDGRQLHIIYPLGHSLFNQSTMLVAAEAT